MAKGIFIIGTGTNVGKTIVSAGIMYLLLSTEYNACYFKPVSSGVVDAEGNLTSYDAQFVKSVSGLMEDDSIINPYRFTTPVSPHLASRIEGIAVNTATILKQFETLKRKYEFIIAEGCGGLAVPLNNNGYMLYDLIHELEMVCIVVARTELGTINHTILTVKYAEFLRIKIKGIVFSGYQGSRVENDNIETLKKLVNIPVLGIIPHLIETDVEDMKIGNLKEVFTNAIDLNNLIKLMNEI